jgi:hypothetical protein
MDDPDKTSKLMEAMQACLPIKAQLQPHVISELVKQSPDVAFARELRIVRVLYAGEEGGIMCALEMNSDFEPTCFMSLTYLRFDPQHPLYSLITEYQRTRINTIRKNDMLSAPKRSRRNCAKKKPKR